jgi:co-chaperonin GroES (HSP10)
MPYMVMDHVEDPKSALYESLGDLDSVKLFNNQVLCAIYIRPQKTKSGIYLPDKVVDEDKYQGKVGLVVKTGPSAFVDPTGKWFSKGQDAVEILDWVIFRPSEGWSIEVNGVTCRILDDTNIRGVITRPDQVW